MPFDDVPTDEDLVWSARLKPHIRSAIRAGEPGDVLYRYRWDAYKVFGT
jgi:hypothetical protein